MLAHGLTTEDIEAKAKAKREAKATNGKASNAESKAVASLKGGTPPKYQHPKTGATWTGHGRAPVWIANVRDRSKYLIASSADAALAASAGTASKVKPAAKKATAGTGEATRKGQRKGPQPVKYLDPKTGATWSGRGPAPAWLAAVKDHSKFLIADAGADSADAGSAKVASKKATSKKVAEKEL